MPHGWRSRGRSAVSPRACATESPAAMPSGLAGAFADRTAIDWTALLERVHDTRGRAALQALRRLDELRGRRRGAAVPPERAFRIFALRLLVVVAALQTACGLARGAATIAGGGSIGRLTPALIIAVAFASAGVLLASAAARDRRVLLLLASFTFASSAFARALVGGLSGGFGGGLGGAAALLFRGVVPEAFAPAALAQFAVPFPAVQRFTPVDVRARRGAAGAWARAPCLFAAN